MLPKSTHYKLLDMIHRDFAIDDYETIEKN
jgi:hypothetical protein